MGLLLESLLQRINGASPGEFASGLLLESLLQRINGASPGEFATEN